MLTSPTTEQARALADSMRCDGGYMEANTVDALTDDRDALTARVAELEAALRKIWDMQGNSAIGEIARAALAKGAA